MQRRKSNPSLTRRSILSVPKFRYDQKHAETQAGIELARDERLSTISSNHRRVTEPSNQDLLLIPVMHKTHFFEHIADNRREKTFLSRSNNATTLRIRTMSEARTECRDFSDVKTPDLLKLKNMLQP